MKIYAHEMFATFKEAMTSHFSDSKSRRWVQNYDFQNNAVKIWEEICEFQKISIFSSIQSWVLNLWYSASQMILIFILFIAFVGICMKEHLRDQTVACLPWIICLIIACLAVIFIYRFYKKEKT